MRDDIAGGARNRRTTGAGAGGGAGATIGAVLLVAAIVLPSSWAMAQSTLGKLHQITPVGGTFTRDQPPHVYLNNRGLVAWADRYAFGTSFLWVPQTPNGVTGSTRELGMLVTDLNDAGQMVGHRLSGLTLRHVDERGEDMGDALILADSASTVNSRFAINNRG